MTYDHVLKIELGEYTTYHLTCNLGETAPCHTTCSAHPEGGCGEIESEGACVTAFYEGGCVVAEWVNDGGIEAVGFGHTLELPVEYRWNASHDYPTIFVKANQ